VLARPSPPTILNVYYFPVRGTNDSPTIYSSCGIQV
jgi:hypothetical protein